MEKLICKFEDGNFLTLEEKKVNVIDIITSKYLSYDDIINKKYYEKIGVFAYDNYINDNANKKILISYKLTKEDKEMLSKVMPLMKLTGELNTIYKENTILMNLDYLENKIFKENYIMPSYIDYLKQSSNYYMYLRIINDYYDNIKKNKLLIKK